MRIFALALLAVALAGCGGSSKTTKGSGHVVSASRTVSGFTTIRLIGAATVDVTVGKPAALTLSGDDNILPLIRTDVRDGALEITSEHSYSSSHDLHVTIATPSLEGISLIGAGTFSAGGIHAHAFALDLSGAATLILAGATDTLDATLSGSGTADLTSLVARDAKASLSGAGTLHVDATKSLDASLSGVGSIVYSGSPAHVTTHVSGVGTIAAG